MTTPNESGMVQESAAVGVPVWQPPLAPAGELGPIEGTAAGDQPTEDAPSAVLPARARRAGSTTALLAIVAMVAFCGIGFAVGRATATGQSGTGQTAVNGLPAAGALPSGLSGPSGVSGLPGDGAIPGGLPAFGEGGDDGRVPAATTVSGTVVSVTPSSITVKLASGETVTVAIGSATVYKATTTASSSDVKAGSTVVIETSRTASSSSTAGTRTATNVIVTRK